MKEIKSPITLSTVAKFSNGLETDVIVNSTDDGHYKGHPRIQFLGFESCVYYVGNLIVYYKAGMLDDGLIVQGNLICSNIKDILKELKEKLNFAPNIS